MFTCISCRIAFEDAIEQRAHFSTDWHRYNMKRRVANLPPVPASSFNEKVIERREQNAVKLDPKELSCRSCSKTFSTENAYKSHIVSRRHQEREKESDKGQSLRSVERLAISESEVSASDDTRGGSSQAPLAADTEDIAIRLAIARRKIQPTDCLFCTKRFSSITDVAVHMSRSHSFFIPEREHLSDLAGLLGYLGEKVVVGNLCLFCPNGGREFASVDAVRKHMIDKGHCKMAFETDEDLAETSEYYDWHVPDGLSDSDWEDTDELQDEVTRGVTSGFGLSSDGLSLTLPSGRVLGHRSLRVYYSQQFRSRPASSPVNPISQKVQRMRQLLADPTQALVPIAGGVGAFGRGLHVVKARNPGEAAWARKQARSFKDQRVREAHKTRVGFTHNSQKHFRDPLLQ